MTTDEISHKAHNHEIDLRVIGQALETLGIDSFELVLEKDHFVVHGGAAVASPSKTSAAVPRPRLFQRYRGKINPQRSKFYISGMRFRESDVLRLDHQAKDIRSNLEGCPDTSSLSHGLRMIGAHIDNKRATLMRVVRNNHLFTVWYKKAAGGESRESFTQSNLYDLWVHLYKQRRNPPKRNGTANQGF